MGKLEIIEIECSKLIPYENNARINDKAVEFVANSIKEFGMKNPIIIDSNMIIIAGHTRLKALLTLGIQKAPCIIADDLTDEQIKAFRIADNSTAQIAEWDMQLLSIELNEIHYDMSVYGCEKLIEDIERLNESNGEEDNYIKPDNLVSKAQLGDVWKLGRHRLICGDSTDKEIVKKLMNGLVADLCVTDPPYNINYESKQDLLERSRRCNGGGSGSERFKAGELVSIENDKLSDLNFAEFLGKAYSVINDNLRVGGVLYIFHSGSESANFITQFKQFFKHYETLIWVKNNFALSRLDYHYQHEPIIYGYKEGAKHFFIDDRTQTTVFEDTPPEKLKLMKKDELVKYCEELLARTSEVSTTIIRENKLECCDIHPTMKPIKLLAKLIKNSSKANEIVLDIFGGSGSTLIACEQLNRTCYMSELDPNYCDGIINRWEKLTGGIAEIVKG